MFTKKSFIDEIANSMERQLVDGAINKQAETQARLVKAADFLNAAAEIFDETGMSLQSEVVTAVLESLAAKKKKKKVKSKSVPKKKSLTSEKSEKMVENFKGKSWMFDKSEANDKNYAHDHNHIDDNCAMCGDMSYSDDKLGKGIWHFERGDEPSVTSRHTGTHDTVSKHHAMLERDGDKWNRHGPYDSHLELEEKHFPHFFKDHSSADDSELYSMLDNFKSNMNEDFEDDGNDDFEVEIHDPFKNTRQTYVDDIDVHDPFEGYDRIKL